MGWIDASEYLMLEQAAKDRIEDATRFREEQAFRFGTAPKEPATRPSPPRCLAIDPKPAAS